MIADKESVERTARLGFFELRDLSELAVAAMRASPEINSAAERILEASLEVAATIDELARFSNEVFAPLMREILFPGTYLGDLVRAYAFDYEALRRLVTGRFSRRAVIYYDRWSLLEPHFEAQRAGRGRLETWYEIAVPALFIAISSTPPEGSQGSLYSWLRREMRREIEIHLLGGRTLDSKGEELIDPRSIGLLVGEDWDISVEDYALLRQLLDTLSPVQLEAVLGVGAGTSAERKRKSRAFKKLRAEFGVLPMSQNH